MGGKSANIVFADADLDKAAATAPYAVFDNAGQDCCARSRILVERSVHDQVVEVFVAATRTVVVGDPADPATEMGPLVSQRHMARVLDYIDVGRTEGARLVTGGERMTGGDYSSAHRILKSVSELRQTSSFTSPSSSSSVSLWHCWSLVHCSTPGPRPT